MQYSKKVHLQTKYCSKLYNVITLSTLYRYSSCYCTCSSLCYPLHSPPSASSFCVRYIFATDRMTRLLLNRHISFALTFLLHLLQIPPTQTKRMAKYSDGRASTEIKVIVKAWLKAYRIRDRLQPWTWRCPLNGSSEAACLTSTMAFLLHFTLYSKFNLSQHFIFISRGHLQSTLSLGHNWLVVTLLFSWTLSRL